MADKLLCPNANLNCLDRKNALNSIITKWIHSEELYTLIKVFGGENLLSTEDTLPDFIDKLNQFVEQWDFRKKQVQGGERWGIYNEEIISQHEQLILKCAEGLGMVSVIEPQIVPDYILPLGGARMTNLNRPKMAKYIIDQYNWHNKIIVALSGNRAISSSEKLYINTYAPIAKSEYDAINMGLENTFNIKKYSEIKVDNANSNLIAYNRTYLEEYKECKIYSLAAPSENATKRANSLDTFNYFMKTFHIEPYAKLLLVTSSIYVPYQLMKFIPIAMQYNIEVDIIGSDVIGGVPQRAVNYLQEIKSTINAIWEYFLESKIS